MIARGWPSWLLPLIVALALRVWGLGEVPTTLTDDEAQLGSAAWSIAHTVRAQLSPFGWIEGTRDEARQLPPRSSEGGGEYPISRLGEYAVAISIALFGPTPFAVRLPFAVGGALSVIPAAIVGQAIHGSRVAGEATALLLATSPWHLAFTRVARDGTWLVFGLLLMTAGLISARAKLPRLNEFGPIGLVMVGAAIATLGDPSGAIAAASTAIAVGVSLCVWAPDSSGASGASRQTSVPTECAPLASPVRDPRERGVIAAHVAAALLAVAPLALLLGAPSLGPDGEARAQAITTSTKRLAIDGSGITGGLQMPWAVLGRAGLDAYAAHFDLTFLFTRGDGDKRNHATGFGQLSIVELPLVVGGGFLALHSVWSRRPSGALSARWPVVIAWLLVAPLPAAFAVSGADAARSIGMVPALALLEAGAVAAVWPRLVQRRVTFETRLLLGVSTVTWALATAVHDPVEAARAFGSGTFTGYEWARAEVAAGRASQLVLVGDASQGASAARLAMRVDPTGSADDERVAVRETVDWARERRDIGVRSRLYALHGGAQVPDGFTLAHLALAGDRRPVVTFVRVAP